MPQAATPDRSPDLLPLFTLPAALASDMLLRAQNLQWETLMAWQRALSASQQAAWSQWTGWWQGGVPIDG